MNPFQQHGAFSWCELITPDVAAAREFYSQVFGWTLKEGPVAGMPYTVIEAGGQEIGGIVSPPPNQPNMPPMWGVYITVENLDSTVETATALGGDVLMPPMQVDPVGRFALLKDPQGAMFCAIQYNPPA